jgi:hypothetical protein
VEEVRATTTPNVDSKDLSGRANGRNGSAKLAPSRANGRQPGLILPVHFQLIVNRADAVDGAESFLGHLLLKEAFHPALKHEVPAVSAEENPTLMQVRMAND